jgi:hypothetical protein
VEAREAAREILGEESFSDILPRERNPIQKFLDAVAAAGTAESDLTRQAKNRAQSQLDSGKWGTDQTRLRFYRAVVALAEKISSAAGLEEVEAMPLTEFEQDGRFQLSDAERQRIDQAKYDGSGKVLLKELPLDLYVYVQGDGLFSSVLNYMKRPRGVRLDIQRAAETAEWKEPGLILKDQMLSEVLLDNPKGLPEQAVFAADVPRIDPAQLLAWFFRDLPAIQAENVVGQMLVTDGKKMFLVLFSA